MSNILMTSAGTDSVIPALIMFAVVVIAAVLVGTRR